MPRLCSAWPGTVRELDTAGVVVRELVFREGMFLSALEAVDADTP